MIEAPAPGLYRHYKGGEYDVLGSVLHSETEERLVLYRPRYGERELWVRPVAMFREDVVVDGKSCPRFAWIGPSHGGDRPELAS